MESRGSWGSSKTKTEYKFKSATVSLKKKQLSFDGVNEDKLKSNLAVSAGKKGFESFIKVGFGSPKAKAARYLLEYILLSGELGEGSTPNIDFKIPLDYQKANSEIMTKYKLSEFFQRGNFKISHK